MSIEEVFLEFCRASPEGASEKEFREKYSEHGVAEVAVVINELSAKGYLELAKRGNQLICKAVSSDAVET